jgi:cell division protein FtsB
MIDAETLMKLGTASVVGLAGLAMGVQQLVKKWKATSAETNIMSLLHAELERMSAQNTLLATYVNSLQLEANKINLELGKLQYENQKLHAEVVSLTKEVILLRGALPETRERVI